MIISHRGVRVEEFSARIFDHAVLHRRARITLQERRGITLDDALFASAFAERLDDGRHDVLVSLNDPLGLRPCGRPPIELRAGEVVSLPRSAAWRLRYSPRASVLIVEVPSTAALRASEGTSQLHPDALARLRASVTPLATRDLHPRAYARAVSRSLAILRAEGLPLEPMTEDDLLAPANDEDDADLVYAIDHAIARLDRGVRSVDIEELLGLGPRQVHRRLCALHDRFAYNARGVRDLFLRWRLYVAAALASCDAATTERIARATGYGSPDALCRALASRGLPGPRGLRREVRALGDSGRAFSTAQPGGTHP